MNAIRVAAILLVLVGALQLLLGSAGDIQALSNADPESLMLTTLQAVDLSVWLGVSGIVIGSALMLVARKKG